MPSYPPTAVHRKPLPPSTQFAAKQFPIGTVRPPLSLVTKNTRNITTTTSYPPPPLESLLLPERTSNPQVVKVRKWLTLGVPFPVVYRVNDQLVTAIMPAISGNKKGMGRKVFILEDQVDSSQKIRCPLPGD